MTKIPKFKNDDEIRKFWEKEDFLNYVEDTEEIKESIEISSNLRARIKEREVKKAITLRIEPTYINEVKRIAEEKGLPYQTLIRMWIIEMIKREKSA
jgi:predicted DNA binding CopG/RHH family protein